MVVFHTWVKRAEADLVVVRYHDQSNLQKKEFIWGLWQQAGMALEP